MSKTTQVGSNMFSNLNLLHIVGPKKSGKTTLIEFLLQEFSQRGLRVGAFKHSSHPHPIDKEGSDSDRLRKAGGTPTVFSTPQGMAIFMDAPSPSCTNETLSFAYRNCDLVLVESFRDASGPKIAVEEEEENLRRLKNLIAVVNAKGTHPDLPAFKPQNTALVDFIIGRFDLTATDFG